MQLICTECLLCEGIWQSLTDISVLALLGDSQYFSWKVPVIICQHLLPASSWMKFLSLSLLRKSVKHLNKNIPRMLSFNVPEVFNLMCWNNAGFHAEVEKMGLLNSVLLFDVQVPNQGCFFMKKIFCSSWGSKPVLKRLSVCFHLHHPSCLPQTQLLNYGPQAHQ